MWRLLSELPSHIVHGIAVCTDWLSSCWVLLTELEDDETSEHTWRQWFLLLPVRLIQFLFVAAIWLLTSPVRGWFISLENRANYLKGLPALISVCFLAAILVGNSLFHERFIRRYSSKAVKSLSEKGSIDGLLHAKRLIATSAKPSRENLYVYGLANANLQEAEIANEVMSEIAPDNAIGYPPAHQFRAIALMKESELKTREETLDLLQWHLEQAGFRNQEQRLLMWAKLHQAKNDDSSAAEDLEQAGKLNPIHFFALSELELNRNKPMASKRALEKAADAFAKQVEQRPNDKVSRIGFASALAKLQRFPEAEKVLLAGFEFHQDQDMRSALSELYVRRFDSLLEGATFVEKLSTLMQAMTQDLNQRGIYVRLLQLFDDKLDLRKRMELQADMERQLVSGFNPTAAHFAIGFLGIADTESQSSDLSTATWHLAQAQALQPAMALAYGNLADALANAKPPRLREAELLARQSTSGPIQEPSFYAVLGRILNQKGEPRKTIEILTEVADRFPESQAVQEVLADAKKHANP